MTPDEAFDQEVAGLYSSKQDEETARELWRDAWDAALDEAAKVKAKSDWDARAGMVPEGEVASAVAVQHSLQARLDEETTWAAKWKKERDEARAELAKAWEAGRTDAADAAGTAQCLCLENIRALQPPGGKAK